MQQRYLPHLRDEAISSVCPCRRCSATCRQQGGQPSGSTLNNFECEKTNVPAEVCVRVAMRNGEWVISQGTLPDRPSGASGPGVPRDGCALSLGFVLCGRRLVSPAPPGAAAGHSATARVTVTAVRSFRLFPEQCPQQHLE